MKATIPELGRKRERGSLRGASFSSSSSDSTTARDRHRERELGRRRRRTLNETKRQRSKIQTWMGKMMKNIKRDWETEWGKALSLLIAIQSTSPGPSLSLLPLFHYAQFYCWGALSVYSLPFSLSLSVPMECLRAEQSFGAEKRERRSRRSKYAIWGRERGREGREDPPRRRRRNTNYQLAFSLLLLLPFSEKASLLPEKRREGGGASFSSKSQKRKMQKRLRADYPCFPPSQGRSQKV